MLTASSTASYIPGVGNTRNISAKRVLIFTFKVADHFSRSKGGIAVSLHVWAGNICPSAVFFDLVPGEDRFDELISRPGGPYYSAHTTFY
jgi:hypothetical protein